MENQNRLRIVKIFFSFFLFFFLSGLGASFAAPTISSVSGTLVHKSQINITGSGFGTKIPAAPLMYDDFEDGFEGGWPSALTDGNPFSLDNAGLRGKSTQHARGIFQLYCNWRLSDIVSNEWYWCYNMKLGYNWNFNYDSGILPRKNIKFWQLHANDGARCQSGSIVTTASGSGVINYAVDNSSGKAADGYFYITRDWEATPVNTWFQEEYAFKNSSTPDTRDGRVIYWVNGEKLHDQIQKTWSIPMRTLHVGWADAWEESGSGQPYIYYDDVYIDNTWARVMMGNNPDFDLCNHKEIQIPSFWSDSSITISLNQGFFQEDETVYLFVVDAGGNVSNGYPITIGGSGSGDTTPPGDVSNVEKWFEDGRIYFVWTNPGDQDFSGVKICYNISPEENYPQDPNGPSDGCFVVTGNPGAQGDYNFEASEASNYWFSFFTYDQSGNYCQTVHESIVVPIVISAPNSSETYSTSENTINLGGTTSTEFGAVSITWSNSNTGENGIGSGITNWTINNIPLTNGENIITVEATNSGGTKEADVITVNYNDTIQAWSANSQTGDNDWKDSGITYCVRFLVEGAQISQSGNKIMLGFQGRSFGDYTIRKVSIAEEDPNGGEGDVIDSTWTKVIFDGRTEQTWDTDTITVPQGTEKVSDPIPFSIQSGKDYYVTFKIQSPSVYLNPSSFRELYFETDDHASDVDWSGNGYSVNQYYHALASIYVNSGSGDTTAPGDVANFTATSGPGQITLTWTNPTDTDFAGVMIRYRTDGTNPQNKDDGSPIPNGNDGKIVGSPDLNMSYVHTNLDPTKHYHYSAFSYDTSSNYSQTAYADAQPLSLNNAPVIQSFTGVPSSLNNPGESTTFNVSATDPDGDSLTYTINFGDGTANGSGSHVVHTYAEQGIYTATATVDDGNGHSVGQSLQVPVNDIRPAEPTNVSAN